MGRAFVLLLVSGLAASGATWIVPRVSNQTIAAQTSRASVTIFNRGAEPATIVIELLPVSGIATPKPASITLPSSRTVVYDDVLQSLWSLSQAAGALHIESAQPLTVRARQERIVSAGVAGTEIAAPKIEDVPSAPAVAHLLGVSAQSAVGVVLAAPQSSADLVVLDSSGKVLGQTTVQGNSLLQEIPVASLAAGGTAARAELRVRTGRAIAYLREGDGSTDPLFQLATVDVTPATWYLPAAVHNSSSNTSLVLFNPAGARRAVQLVPLPVPAGATSPVTLTLEPGEIRTVNDLMTDLFKVAADASPVLRLIANPLVFSAVSSTGSLTTVLPLDGALLAEGQSGAIAGVDTKISSFGAVAGADGATARVTLRDLDGAVVATSAPVEMPADSSSEYPVTALFSGASLPNLVSVEVEVTAGSLVFWAKSTEPGTNDVSYRAVDLFEPVTCPQPVISSFSASPATLASAGVVNLYWSSSGAETVRISPAVGAVAYSGTTPVKVSTGTVFTIEAFGECGFTSRTVSVGVGSPAAVGVSSASGAPGTQIAIQISNVGDPEAIGSVIFVAGGLAFPEPVEGVGSAGELLVKVPLISAQGGGYVSGPVSIQLESTGTPKSIPFNILPLSYSGDAVTEMTALLAKVRQGNEAAAAEAEQIDDLVWFVGPMRQATGQYAAVVEKMLSDIAANGSAVVPIALPTADYPNPGTVVVTRHDLEVFLSILATVRTTPLLPAYARAARPTVLEDFGQPKPCLRDDPKYLYCIDRLADEDSNAFDATFKTVTGVPSIIECAAGLASAGVAVVTKYLTFLKDLTRIACYFEPVLLDSFVAEPDNAEKAIRGGSRSTAVYIYAKLQSLYKSDADFQRDMLDLFQDVALNKLDAAFRGCAGTLSLPLDDFLNRMKSDFQAVVRDALKQRPRNIQASVNKLTFKCDLDSVEPQAPKIISVPVPADGESSGKPVYYFVGHRRTRSYLKVTVKPLHFVYLTGRGKTRLTSSRAQTIKTFRAPVDVIRHNPKVFVTSRVAEVGATSVLSDLDQVEISEEIPFVYNLDVGPVRHSHVIRALDEHTWEVRAASTGDGTQPSGTSLHYLGGETELVAAADGPVHAHISFNSAGAVFPYIDPTGAAMVGAITDHPTISAACADGVRNTNDTLSGNFNYTPAEVDCDSLAKISYGADLNGYGRYSGQFTLRIRIDDAPEAMLAAKPPDTPPDASQGGSAPAVTAAGTVNAADYGTGGVSPGEIATLFGTNFGPAQLAPLQLNADVPSGQLETMLGDTRILFDGVPAPMIYAVANQASFVVPYSVAGKSVTQMVVEYKGTQSAPVTIPVVASAPALFTANATGKGQAAALNQDYSVNSPGNPAAPGTYVLLYMTGEGQTSPPGKDGALVGTVLPRPVLPVTVKLNGVVVPHDYAGGAPGLVAGVMQINLKLPENTPSGPVSVTVKVGEKESAPGVTIAVK